ncbi:MAG: ABC transporter ATP-binding protein [Candidatus Heimdallarchaeota archaeon]|nr:MAG: ABC transporter ATP-binding protein [Candidatus Heimdallarchaeota archaeon]
MEIPAIEVIDIHKTYGKGDSAVEAVRGVSLTINKGELFGFLGPNGAGKTTSLRVMVGLLEQTKGEVQILGISPNDRHARDELKSKIGIIPQDISIYEDLTVLENMWFMAHAYKLPPELAEKRIDTLIKEIGLVEKRKSLARTLSGGQKRRLNLIMGIIHDPLVILCDEPTPGLDPQSRVAVWKFVTNLVTEEGKTVVLTTHFMEEADRLSDRVAIIDHGKILVLDTPEKLKASIGEGDLVEIEISDNEKLEAAKEALTEFKGVQEVNITDNLLTVRCLDVIPRMAALLNVIEDLGVDIEHLGIRNTTLEDVFINLTGRSLRD